MKQFIKPLCIVFFSIFLFIHSAAASETAAPETTVGIRQLMTNADQYPDQVIVQGIVSKVFPQDNLIGLIDNPDTAGCDVSKCTKPCDKSTSKECPMKAAKDCAKACPMAAAQNSDPAAQKKCPMMGGDKPCEKSCSMAGSDQCPVKAAKDCAKACPMAAAKDNSQNAEKKCPMISPAEPGSTSPASSAGPGCKAGAENSGKTCPMTADAGKCAMAGDKTCPVSSAANCPKNASKTCGDSGYTLTLPVQWKGDMPEPSTAVRVAGKITHQDGRLLFVAESITAMSN